MEILERMPFKARKAVFDRLEQIASKANMSVEERNQYETEWKIYNDYFNTLDSSRREGLAEGMSKGLAEGMSKGLAEGRKEERYAIASNLKAAGVDIALITSTTGLSAEEVALL